MATSNVSIANGALQRLGAKRIESLTQDHPNARSVNAAFERVRDRLLRRYDWGFAIKRASIAADGTGPTWGDWSRYSLPNDYIRLIRDDESGRTTDWKIEGLHILSGDASPLEIRYVAQITDPNYFDATFIEAFECALALTICEEVTQSTSKKADIRADYDDAIAEAKKSGAIEKPAQDFPEDSWLDARL
jgi:hypothetical protein